ncbi:MAG: calcium-binding protein [Pseudomonadota bacterium]
MFGFFGKVLQFGNFFLGSFFSDLINGRDKADIMFGLTGDDTINGFGDDDSIFGGFGNDELVGGKGNDQVLGGFGKDLLVWNNGDGSDLLDGGFGKDRVQVNFNTDLVNDDLQNEDVVRIADTAYGVSLARTAVNGQSVNGLFELDIRNTETLEVNGGGGDDVFELVGNVADAIALDIDGGANSDSGAETDSAEDIESGDTLDLSELASGVRVDLDINNQGLLPTEGLEALFPEEVGRIEPGAPSQFGRLSVGDKDFRLTDIENLIGTAFDDVLFGNGESNVIIGGDGNDNIHPFGGVDFVDGGAGTDVINLSGAGGLTIDIAAGQAGPNTFVNIENALGSVNGADVIIGDDRDDIVQEVSFTLNNADGVDVNGNVLNGRGDADVILGGAGNDQLIGDDGSGSAGDDALNGEEGNDFLLGGAGADDFGFSAGEGPDVVGDFSVADGDQIVFDAESFGVEGHLSFQNVGRVGDLGDPDAALAPVHEGSNVFVLQGEFNGNAGGAADALAAALAGGEDEGAGFFVYFNTAQNIQRVIFTEDLDDADAAISLVANLGEFNGDATEIEADAIRDALADFEADNFSFDFSTFDAI